MLEKYAIGMLIVLMLFVIIFFLNMLIPTAVHSILGALS